MRKPVLVTVQLLFLSVCYNVKVQHSPTVAWVTLNTEQITAKENVIWYTVNLVFSVTEQQ